MTKDAFKRLRWAQRFMKRWNEARVEYDKHKAYPWAEPSFLPIPTGRGGYWNLFRAEWSVACHAIYTGGCERHYRND